MKQLLIGILVMGSISAFAQDNVILSRKEMPFSFEKPGKELQVTQNGDVFIAQVKYEAIIDNETGIEIDYKQITLSSIKIANIQAPLDSINGCINQLTKAEDEKPTGGEFGDFFSSYDGDSGFFYFFSYKGKLLAFTKDSPGFTATKTAYPKIECSISLYKLLRSLSEIDLKIP